MRLSLALALVSMLVSAPVFGAEDDDDRKKKGKDEKGGAGSSMETGTDPAYSETSDDGPFSPKAAKPAKGKRAASGKRAEPAAKARPRDPIVVYAEPVIGFGAPSDGAADATVITVEAGGRYDLSEKLTFGARLAWSTASIDQPDGTSASSAAFAAPELMLEYRHELSALTTLPLFAGLGVPVAQGDPNPAATNRAAARQAAVNGLADASHGLRDAELYQPKRLPLVLGAGLNHQRNALDLHAYTKFVVGFDLGTDVPAEVPGFDGTFEANAVAIRNVTLAGIAYEFLEQPAVFAGLDAWFAYRAIDPVEFESGIGASQGSRFQFVVEPRVGARFGKLGTAAGFLLPLGGQLGDGGMKGLRLTASYAL